MKQLAPKTELSWAKIGIQMIKRIRVDSIIKSNPDFSDRMLAKIAGVSHTFIAKRKAIIEP